MEEINPISIDTTKLESSYTHIEYLTQKELFEKFKDQLTNEQIEIIKEKIKNE
jgi:hypothetical protein